MKKLHRVKNKFVVLDHTPDVKIKVVGETLEDLFLKAGEGLAHLLYRNYASSSIAQSIISIKVSSVDVNSLLVDFLSEILYQSEIHKLVFFKIKMKHFTNSNLQANLSGRQVHEFDRNIKFVTYHGVRILRGSDGLWQTEVIFDS